MTFLTAEMHQMMTALGWALLHSVWQAAIIYSIVFILHKVIKDMPATLKYNTGILAMAIVFVWFSRTFFSYINAGQVTAVITSDGGNAISHTTGTLFSKGRAISNDWHYYIDQSLPVLVNLYIAGLCILLCRLLYNFYRTQVIRTKGLVPPDAGLAKLFYRYVQQMNIGRNIRFSLSACIDTPMVAGTLKPMVLVPAAIISQLHPDELEAILLHELAHIKRHDYLMNIIQLAIETILFFNPFVWLISKQVRREREHCCDDMVLARTRDALPYAKALASLEVYRQNNNQLTLAAAGNKHLLFNRIKRIMEMKKNTTSYPQMMLAICIMLGLAVSLVWLSPAIAQSKKAKLTKKDAPKETETFHSTKKNITIIHKDGVTKTYTSAKEISDEDAQTLKDANIGFDDEGAMHQGDVKVFSDSIKIVLDDNDAHGSMKVISMKNGTENEEPTIEELLREAMKETDIAKKIAAAFQNLSITVTTDDEGNHKSKVIEFNTSGAGWDEEDDKKAIEKAKQVIVIADKQIAEANKQLAEADKRLADADKQLKKNKIAIVLTGDKPSGRTKVTISENYDEALNNMEAEGLISTNNGFVIEKKDNKLYINNELQPADVYNRYKSSIDGHHVKISGTKDNLNVHVYNR